MKISNKTKTRNHSKDIDQGMQALGFTQPTTLKKLLSISTFL
jgi:ferritin-like protein